jgi:hypothetical protein
MSEDPDTLWPPQEGQLLPRAAEAVGMRIKLAAYSLDLAHEKGGPKAKGFKLILGITIEDIDYLEDAIETAILGIPICEVRPNPPHGINCVVDFELRGLRDKSDRIANIRTAWELTGPGEVPRLVTAYPTD